MTAAALLLAGWAPPATPAEGPSPPALEPVVVVATRQARPVTEIAGNVTVITRDTLDGFLAASFDDAFRYVPGIDVASTGLRFATEGLILRGIGGNRVRIELDGVPVSRHFAVGSFSNASRDLPELGQVQRIEVLHGPASALYGSDALGGVVAISTPAPGDLIRPGRSGGWGLDQGLRAADDSQHTQGYLAAAGDALSGLVSVTHRTGHEPEAGAAPRPDPRDVSATSVLARLAWEDAAGNVIRASYYGHRGDVATHIQSLLGTGRFARTTRLEGDDSRRSGLGLLEYELAEGSAPLAGTLRAYTAKTDVAQETLDERAAAGRPVRVERHFEYAEDTAGFAADLYRDVDWIGRRHRLAFGVEWTQSRIREMRDGREIGLEDGIVSTTVLGETFPLRDFPESTTRELGVYLQDELPMGAGHLIAGLRFDRYDLRPHADPIYLGTGPDPVTLRRQEFSPRLGYVLPLADGLDAWAQYAHGFRAPSFEDANIGLDIPLFNIRAIPNPDLMPEASDGIEAGLRWRGQGARLDVTAFYTRYDDFIESKMRLGPDPESGRILFQSRNIGDARIYGAEVAAEARVAALPGLRLHAAAVWARGSNLDTDRPMNSVGPPEAVVGASWATTDLRSELTLLGRFSLRHSRLDLAGGALFETPGHGVVDLFVSRRFGDGLVVRLAVENLLNKTWWRWADVRGLAPDDPLIPVLSRPGRSLGIDLAWHL